jgi:hypothetical protein
VPRQAGSFQSALTFETADGQIGDVKLTVNVARATKKR